MCNFQDYLKSVHACAEAREWAGDRTARQAWDECERADWLLWWARRAGIARKTLVRIACACVRPALAYIPAGELRPLRAIEAAEAWCEGRATIKQVRDAYAAAFEAAFAADAANSAAAAYADAAYADAYADAAYADAYAAAAEAAFAAAAAADGVRSDAAAYAADAAAADAAGAAAYAAGAQAAATAVYAAAADAAADARFKAHRTMCAIVRDAIKFADIETGMEGSHA